MYSYDALENLVGCDIHSADRIMAEWQQIALGDEVRLAPQVATTVAACEPGSALVLSGGVQIGNTAAPYDFTWSFVIQDTQEGTARLIVRERYAYKRAWAALLVEPTETVSFLMSQRCCAGSGTELSRSRAFDLYRRPPGAGSPVVRASGKAYETISAASKRARRELYHSA